MSDILKDIANHILACNEARNRSTAMMEAKRTVWYAALECKLSQAEIEKARQEYIETFIAGLDTFTEHYRKLEDLRERMYAEGK